ncbi:nuclear transport factor 2 family protein [Niabella ginsengisoli]|uniref:Nuclear transport factor 2 family protein n=1 Tax=Niabella ginsengisoli TaxID=522298 RepID=A0ABS9SKM6_9BACT|nr:nuclear transport factor 2 family protein [Niabella ginsengisoli]MCH5598856.1 nuclear transport factor 2 family protein [Niabella ginsengisoli]
MNIVTQTIIQTFFKHQSERNLKELGELFSDKIDWYIPGDETKAPWLGRRSNKQEVSKFYELLWKNTEPISAHIENIFIDNNNAVIAGEFSTRMLQTNKIVDSMFFIQITIQDNLIIKYRLLEDSLAVSKSLTI